MSEQRPVEPSEILDRDGERLRFRGPPAGPPAHLTPAGFVIRALAAGPALTASAFALGAVAGLKAAQLMAGAALSRAGSSWSVPLTGGSAPGPGNLQLFWVHVEVHRRS